jgi:ubiquinone/menaquinone biosynthesis C-methylase UbiE
MLSAKTQHGMIFGIDISEEAVLTSSRVNEKDIKSGKVILKQASVSLIPFSDDFFDIITAIQTHYFWPDLKNNMIEVNRVLKPKGQFVLVSEIYKINYHMTKYKTMEELKELLLNSGFSNINILKHLAHDSQLTLIRVADMENIKFHIRVIHKDAV